MNTKLFNISQKSADKIEEMREKLDQSWTKMTIVSMTQIAFALSLRQYKNQIIDWNDWIWWNKILDIHFLADNWIFYRTLLDIVYKKELNDDEFFWNSSVIKYHTDKWTDILYDLFVESNKDPEVFKDKLIEIVNS